LDALISLYKQLPADSRIQVAEQYQYQPMNSAAIALAESGKIGNVTQAQVSVAHGYHGVSLMRRLLGIQFEPAEIRGVRFSSAIVAGPDRDGAPRAEAFSESNQVVATFEFPGKLGVIDFTDDQYFSWIRSRRLLVRGDRGEINNDVVRYLADYKTPITEPLTRLDAGQDGNLEGYYHKGIQCGSEWVYRNPFLPGRISDDEIAIGTCLDKMDEYLDGGPSFYSLAEASQDHYLGLQMQSAIAKLSAVKTSPQCWAPT
jgi:predicted dehydrogenase